MRRGIALAAFVFTATSAAAETYTFTDMKQEFWRPAPGMSLRIQRQTVTLSSPCFETDLIFNSQDGTLSFDEEMPQYYKKDIDCAPKRVAFEAIKGVLTAMTGYRESSGQLMLHAGERVVLTLEPIAPQGFEYREMAVTAFRHRGKLQPVTQFSVQRPDLVFYDGRINGSIGYGGADGTYTSIGSSLYKIALTSFVTGAGNNPARSGEQTRQIVAAFGGVRAIAPSGDRFVLRDTNGDAQIVLSPVPSGVIP